jgi:hypothetical protein
MDLAVVLVRVEAEAPGPRLRDDASGIGLAPD